MDWFAIRVAETTGPDWLRIPADVRGHWLALLSVCAQRENGGVIEGCSEWTNRDWDRIAGCTRSAIAKLVKWELAHWRPAADGAATGSRSAGDRLVTGSRPALQLVGYDVAGQDKLRVTSAKKRRAAETRWKKRAEAAKSLRSSDAPAATCIEGAHAPAYAESDACNAHNITGQDITGQDKTEHIRIPASRETSSPSKPGGSSKGKKAKKAKTTTTPMPFTVAELIGALEKNANGRIATEQFQANPKRWSAQITKLIRELDAAGYDLGDVAGAARLIAQWKSARPLNWLVSGGNLLGACKSARLRANGSGAIDATKRIGGLTV